jgi:hypothetical protein
MKNKRFIIILLVITFLLLIPFISMQFTDEMNWSFSDFAIMGSMLLIVGVSCEITLRKVSKLVFRIAICLVILVAFLFIWAELAVGILDSIIARL